MKIYYTKKDWSYVVVDEAPDVYASFDNVKDYEELQKARHYTNPNNKAVAGKKQFTLDEYLQKA